MGDLKTVQVFLQNLLAELVFPNGAANTERFASLRDVDAKVREVRTVLDSVAGQMPDFLSQMNADSDFKANSRRIRLEALAHYCRSIRGSTWRAVQTLTRRPAGPAGTS